MQSILENDYEAPTRPFSQKELQEGLKRLKYRLRLSDQKVRYTNTGYIYHVKKGGRKEAEIIEKLEQDAENGNVDVGNCSIRWKLSRTPRDLRDVALDVIDSYTHFKKNPPYKLSHYNLEIFKMFYTWLYYDNFE